MLLRGRTGVGQRGASMCLSSVWAMSMACCPDCSASRLPSRKRSRRNFRKMVRMAARAHGKEQSVAVNHAA